MKNYKIDVKVVSNDTVTKARNHTIRKFPNLE